MTLLIRDLKPALTNVLGVIKRNQHIPTLEAAKITAGDGKLKLLATDRFIIIEHAIDYKIEQEFSYALDGESLQLLAKLPPLQQVDFTPDGVVAKNIKFTPADVDYPEAIEKLLEDAWGDDWKKPAEREWELSFKPELVKHIKDVLIIPHPKGGQKARLQAPDLRGLMMGARLKEKQDD